MRLVVLGGVCLNDITYGGCLFEMLRGAICIENYTSGVGLNVGYETHICLILVPYQIKSAGKTNSSQLSRLYMTNPTQHRLFLYPLPVIAGAHK